MSWDWYPPTDGYWVCVLNSGIWAQVLGLLVGEAVSAALVGSGGLKAVCLLVGWSCVGYSMNQLLNKSACS